jgi:predicted nucleotidyltransferase
MDIDLSFIKNKFFLNTLHEYFERLFEIGKKINGVVLFGSLAIGNAIYSDEKVSDVDLLIIFADNELPKDHRKRTDLKIDLMGFTLSGVDSIWLTQTEFEKSMQNKVDLILSILDEGIILHDPFNLIKLQKQKLFQELEKKGVKKREKYWIWPLNHLGEEIEW